MGTKRSRVGTSLSLGETELIHHVSLPIGERAPAPAPAPAIPTLPVKFPRPSLKDHSSGFQKAAATKILSLPSPERPAFPAVKPPKFPRLSMEEHSSGFQQAAAAKILSMLSPENRKVYGGGNQRIGYFLEQCHYCKSKISEDKDVFMYRDLQAFCTDACREAQICLDNLKENQTLKW